MPRDPQPGDWIIESNAAGHGHHVISGPIPKANLLPIASLILDEGATWITIKQVSAVRTEFNRGGPLRYVVVDDPEPNSDQDE